MGVRSLARALAQLAAAEPTPEEEADWARCEGLRARLEGSTEEVGNVFELVGGTARSTVAAEAQLASISRERARLLYRLVALLGPDKVVEFGSAFGLSGSYIASALSTTGAGRLVTVEGSPSRHAVAKEAIESVAPGRTEAIVGFFDDHLSTLDGAGLFFLDGNHRGEPTKVYVNEAVSRMARPALIVLDDVVPAWPEVVEVWRELQKDRRFSAQGETPFGFGVLGLGDVPIS